VDDEGDAVENYKDDFVEYDEGDDIEDDK